MGQRDHRGALDYLRLGAGQRGEVRSLVPAGCPSRLLRNSHGPRARGLGWRGLGPREGLWRDACALGCVARSAEEDDAGGISDETRQSRWPQILAPEGLPRHGPVCRVAALRRCDRASTASRRLASGVATPRDLRRDASALGWVARSASEDDAGGSATRRDNATAQPRCPSGSPLGRASPLSALLPVSARYRRAVANPSRPSEQRAESP